MHPAHSALATHPFGHFNAHGRNYARVRQFKSDMGDQVKVRLRPSGMRGRLLLRHSLLLCTSSPAGATTVGGLTTWSNGPFAFAGAAVIVPTLTTDNQGEASPTYPAPTSAIVGLWTLVPGSGGWQTKRLVQFDNAPSSTDLPSVAVSGSTTAVAWISAAAVLQSALVQSGRFVTRAMHAASDTIHAYNVAAAPNGSRAVVWSDAAGIQLQAVPGGAAVTFAAGARSDIVTTSSDSVGGWWALWRANDQLSAAHVGPNGLPRGGVLDVAPESATSTPPAHLLEGGGRRWIATADGRGGMWVSVAHELLHLTDAGVNHVLASATPVVLAGGDSGAGAVATRAGGNDIVVHRLDRGRLGAPILLRRAGFLIDVAFDATRRSISVLSAGARNSVRLTEISAGGRAGPSAALRFCSGRPNGQVAASNGLVAVACAAGYNWQDSVMTGGDALVTRHDGYYVLRAGRLLRHNNLLDGEYGY